MWIISPNKVTLLNTNFIESITKNINNGIEIKLKSGDVRIFNLEFSNEVNIWFDNIIKGLEQEACK